MKIKLNEHAFAPVRAHATDAGMDIMSPVDMTVPARGSAVIDTGVCIELPRGTVGMLKSKSGLNVKHGIVSEGVIDEGYRGAIAVKLYNHSDKPYSVRRGDKITQLVVMPCFNVEIEITDTLSSGERGECGFGSSGR